MKQILLLLLLLPSCYLFAQVEATSTTINNSTELEVISPNNNTGVLLPALSSAQITAIASPANGLLVYNTDKKIFMYNAGTTTAALWTAVGQAPAIANFNAATTPVAPAGTLIYDATTNKKLYYSNGTAWVALAFAAYP